VKHPSKVLVTLPWNDASVEGGAERSVYTLLNNLPGAEYKIYVVVILKKGNKENVLKHFGDHIKVNVIYAEKGWKSIWRLKNFIRDIEPHLIIGNVLHICTITIIANLLSGKKSKVISINRGMDIRKNIEKLHLIFVYYLSNRVVAISEGLKNQMEKNLIPKLKKISVVYNPFALEDIRRKSNIPLLEKEVSWERSRKTVIYIGRFDERQKNVILLLKAFAIVSKNFELNLLLVGDGKDRKILKEMSTQLDITEKVHFLGLKENPFSYLSMSDILVLSSNFEGFGRVLVEALACGVSVVSTDCRSGPAEILSNGKYGALVPVGDAKAMGAAIESTLKSPKSPSVLQKRANFFSIESSVREFQVLLKEVLTS